MESANDRFERDLNNIRDDRKVRGWDNQPDERRLRRYYPHYDPAADDFEDSFGDNY